MIEACDRLAQKLDEVVVIVREQIQAMQRHREPAAPESGVRQTPAHVATEDQAAERLPLAEQAPVRTQQGRPKIQRRQDDGSRALDESNGESAGATDDAGMAALAGNAGRLVDTFARSRDGWQEQAAGLLQSLEAIMEFLEGHAATPKVDAADIMSRLRNLEEEQQSLQSQFNTNRWGP
jgi:hypothetical protein